MKKEFRKGAVGALMDEYERAATELKSIVEKIDQDNYTRILDTETTDDDCRSIQTIMNHVVHSAYGYANAVRRIISMPHTPLGVERPNISPAEIGGEIDKALAHTEKTLDGMWEMSYEDQEKFIVSRKADFSENLEQLLEHAIVHVLRHRRQIEKFLLKSSDSGTVSEQKL